MPLFIPTAPSILVSIIAEIPITMLPWSARVMYISQYYVETQLHSSHSPLFFKSFIVERCTIWGGSFNFSSKYNKISLRFIALNRNCSILCKNVVIFPKSRPRFPHKFSVLHQDDQFPEDRCLQSLRLECVHRKATYRSVAAPSNLPYLHEDPFPE